MNVLLVNGSPHARGCTYTALAEVAKSLEAAGVGTEIFQLGTKPVSGCLACKKCIETLECIIDDVVNEFLEKSENFDAFVFGSPVHYAAASGMMTSFLDRVFYGKGQKFWLKPAAAIVSCRRGGATAALDQLNKYFAINNMPMVTSQYWNMVHGNTPEEVMRDAEGMQTLRRLGANMAWLLKSIDAGKKAGIPPPAAEERAWTNFIR